MNKTAQVTLEFAFSMIIVLLMMYTTIMVFRWAGLDLVERRVAHDRVLTQNVIAGYVPNAIEKGPMRQLDPYFYKPIAMNAIFDK